MKGFLTLLFFTKLLFSNEVFVVSKTSFSLNDEKHQEFINQKFIVVDIEDGLGNFFAFDKGGKLFMSGKITAGAYKYKTPEGIFKIIQKKKHHMSTIYPSDDGRNNMDDMLKITNSGVALHKGSLKSYSHGCIHIDSAKSAKLYEWAPYNTPVIITRDYYTEFFNNF